MTIKISTIKNTSKPSATLFLVSHESVSKLLKSQALPKAISGFIQKSDLKKLFQQHEFKGKNKQFFYHELVTGKNITSLLFYGVDEQERKTSNFMRDHGCNCLGKISSQKLSSLALSLELHGELTKKDIHDFLEGMCLKDYSFDSFKSKKSKKRKTTTIFLPKSKLVSGLSIRDIETLTKSTFFARDLVNTPANKCGPGDVVRLTRARLKNSGVRITVYNRTQLKKMSAHLLLSVADGSAQAPYLMKLVYKPKQASKKPPLAIVGKGVTFDSGGLSIKSGAGMMAMKCDMAGAAAVIGAMDAIAKLKPKREVRAYVPLVENMINGKATRPGDIIKGMHGKTVEILNTDAEGRLILSDALTLADKDGAKKIVSLATLTGACMVALGNSYAGLFANNETLCEQLKQASAATGELLWELPLAEEYKEMLKSHPADIKNIGGAYAGAITAALFLQHAIKKAEWAHIDLAGPAFLESPSSYNPKGGTGFGVRTLVEWVSKN